MSKQNTRNRRVADLVQRKLALLLQKEVKDPRLGFITVSATDLSPDLRNAKVYITSLDNNVDTDKVIEALNSMAGHFRHELAKDLALRVVPRLKFIFDSSVQRGSHLSSLIDSLVSEDRDSVDDKKS